jgi:ABC-type branched-subunit amino acid transport system ATPase component
MSSQNDEGLNVIRVCAGYGSGPVIADVSLNVRPGAVVALLGPNGAGKSTLLKAITGNIPVTSGQISLQGRDITNLRGDRIARLGLGYVPQVNDTFTTMTVRENLEMGGYVLLRSEVPERVETVMAVFPALRPLLGTRVNRLSGGEKKMVAVGRVLMLRPTVLIIDEPTAGLSPRLSRDVLENHVRRLADANVAVLLVEQKPQEALKVADWACIMVNGALEVEGRPDELLARRDIGEVFLGLSVDDAPDTVRVTKLMMPPEASSEPAVG